MNNEMTPWFLGRTDKPTRDGVYVTCRTPLGNIFYRRWFQDKRRWSPCCNTLAGALKACRTRLTPPRFWRGFTTKQD
jgi:hypothetical protein